MEVQIYGSHLDITDGISEHINSKLQHVRVPDGTVRVEFRLKKERKNNSASVKFQAKGKTINITQRHEDMYAAIDELIHKMQRETIKYKEKYHTHVH